MKLIGKLLGSDQAIEKAGKFLDKAWFTKEERAKNWSNVLKSYEPFKVAQRFLALMFGLAFVLIVLIAVVLLILSVFNPKYLEAVVLVQELLKDTLATPISLIFGFYFGGGAIEGIVNKIKEKKKE